jgi:hypothetical protein
MTALIARLRRLIGDPAGASQTWQDEDLQDALDRHRREARYAYLRPVESIAQGGAISYLTYVADMPDWEGLPALADGNYAALTAATEDLLTGRWTFAAEPQRPVRITGWYYDVHGAAVEILEAWIAKLKGSIDLSVDGLSLKRSQKVEHLETLLDRCSARQWADTGCVIQTDFTPSARHYGAW